MHVRATPLCSYKLQLIAVPSVLLLAQRNTRADLVPRRPSARRPVVRHTRRPRPTERQDGVHHGLLVPEAGDMAGLLQAATSQGTQTGRVSLCLGGNATDR
jgi:hypothetical protein